MRAEATAAGINTYAKVESFSVEIAETLIFF